MLALKSEDQEESKIGKTFETLVQKQQFNNDSTRSRTVGKPTDLRLKQYVYFVKKLEKREMLNCRVATVLE